ncbi:hypothetical protein Gotur_001967, partial [Gossypium turneri]
MGSLGDRVSIDCSCKSFTNFQEEEPMVVCYSSIFSL